ncbi:MAG TPA: helix-turn-helix transcriptional regulator [Armatimonadota bacterium]
MPGYRVNHTAFNEVMKTHNIPTPAALARRINVSKSMVTRVLKGQRNPGASFMSAVETAFSQYAKGYFFTPIVNSGEHEAVNYTQVTGNA